VVLGRDVGRMPKLIAAWWVEPAGVIAIARHLQRFGGTDVPGMARELRVVVQPHAMVVSRAHRYVAKMDARLAEAKRVGALRDFNQRYAIERRKARAEGRPLINYGPAFNRLRVELYKAASGEVNAAMINRALGIEPKE
jgi:hypothetical protein